VATLEELTLRGAFSIHEAVAARMGSSRDDDPAIGERLPATGEL